MPPQDENAEFAENYRAYRRDIRFVAATNLLILAALVGLYFLDRKFGFVSALLEKF